MEAFSLFYSFVIELKTKYFSFILGTHDELIASALKGESAGIYANLWNMQLQHRDSPSIVLTPLEDNEEVEIKLV